MFWKLCCESSCVLAYVLRTVGETAERMSNLGPDARPSDKEQVVVRESLGRRGLDVFEEA